MNRLKKLLCKLHIKHSWEQNRVFSVEDLYPIPYRAYKHLRRECPFCGTKQEWRRYNVIYAENKLGEWVTVKEYTPDLPAIEVTEAVEPEDHAVVVDCAATRCIWNDFKLKRCSTNIITVTKNGKCLDFDTFGEEDLIMLGFDKAKHPELFEPEEPEQK